MPGKLFLVKRIKEPIITNGFIRHFKLIVFLSIRVET